MGLQNQNQSCSSHTWSEADIDRVVEARTRRENSERKSRVILIILLISVVVVVAASLSLGRYPIDPLAGFCMLINSVSSVIVPFWSSQDATIFFNVRLPRILLALMVGASLSVAGAAFQGTFQNPLVSPNILGASQGAAFGAALAILLGLTSSGISLMAFGFALATVAIVIAVAKAARGNPIVTVVLAGVMISSLFGAGVSFLKLVADPMDELPAITYWLMGSLTGARMKDVMFAFPFIFVGISTLYALRWRINLLTMGDDEAKTMGVDTSRLRLIIIIAATLITAVSVAVSGMIGWVGLVIPHLSRMLIGCDYRKLIPASLLMGSGFLLIVDDIARLATTSEIPIGILTAFIGAPFFLYLIMREGRKKS